MRRWLLRHIASVDVILMVFSVSQGPERQVLLKISYSPIAAPRRLDRVASPWRARACWAQAREKRRRAVCSQSPHGERNQTGWIMAPKASTSPWPEDFSWTHPTALG